MIHRIITSDGLTPGLSFQVARPDAIRDKPGRLRRDLGQADRKMLSRAKIRIAPIDDGAVADEQGRIDLYFRWGLIKQNLDAAEIVWQ